MTTLLETLMSELGGEAVANKHQYPRTVISLIVPKDKFVVAAKALKKADAFLTAEWATDETMLGGGFGIYACYRCDAQYLVVKTKVSEDDPTFPSLIKKYVPAYRFERQMSSLMGVIPVGHTDMRPWIKFENWPPDAWPLRKSFAASTLMPSVQGDYQWIRAYGEGVYEIPVGPVHAGIIEPGHFRFQAVGENIINLEARLGYVHKGIEKRFEVLSFQDGVRLAARVSGDTTVAHSIAYSIALETMTGCRVPQRGHWLRALFLERERIANHLGDIGAICNDAAFAFMLYQLSRLKETLLRTNRKLFGHRFIMDRVVPGGCTVDIDTEGKAEILVELDVLAKQFQRLVRIYEENPSLEDRVRDTGVFTPEIAKELCTVGVVARASGLKVDCRVHQPFPPYDSIEVKVPVLISGDVHARVWVRVKEIRESIRIIKHILENLPDGAIRTDISMPISESEGFAAVEGWRGEIIYWLQAGADAQINRCMVRDPSSVNWLGLEQAIKGNIVPDFPLCNKSFNQSYSGHDL
ncbi:MAG: NADH-quinone oxidoreductase subunit C [Candidatus Magnetoovum sp. WYHC-5]|nr:NADH-quinone oxidoreductase subunit C [Candidatus Magnetoovum sp. WYHC-5]